MRLRSLWIVTGFLLAMLAGYFVARSAAPEPPEKEKTVANAKPRGPAPHEVPEPEVVFKKGDRPAFQTDDEAINAGAIVGQRTLQFKDRAALEAFLARAGGKVSVLGRLDALNVLRIGFLNYADLADLLDGTETLGMIFPAYFPENDTVAAQAGAVAMGNRLLQWLGLTGDMSGAGNGVKVAILDTGVNAHSSFGAKILAMLGAGDVNGHGTAVASFIAGNSYLTPGVAPDSTILSYQIGDAEGYSDSFKIAEAILAAIDAGADIINISFGSRSQSDILSQAVAKAIDAGLVIVAAAGNSGSNFVYWPAADQGVIGVGATDAKGEVMSFSNTGNGIDVVAPGYGMNAAYLNDSAVAVSGTSFSAPIVAGLISKVVSDSAGKLNANQAWELIRSNLNEAGAPGYDTVYGWGIPDMTRVENASTKDLYDAAVSSYWIDPKRPGEVQVTIQNQGTETLINTGLSVTTTVGRSTFNVTTLAPGAIQTFTVPIATNVATQTFDSSVTLSGGKTDYRPANNRLSQNATISTGR